ncbi:MAG TPA: DNA alkylation repair protein [Gemmatimonadales bacterium]|nr:DNA alkylation repair protein [Gemmatimonadales bacterium]
MTTKALAALKARPQAHPQALEALKKAGSRKVLAGYARYGIATSKAFGIPMKTIQALGKKLGKDHVLAEELWKSGWYEARLLACYVEDPARVTPAQMERWARGFDNWAICDTVTFVCWDKTPHAWTKIAAWSRRKEEFVKRAGFALLAAVALHDKSTPAKKLLASLKWIERGAADERNFVKKGVSWALRTVGRQRPKVHSAAVALTRRLITSESKAAQWVGRDALKDLTRPLVLRAIARRTT